MNTTPLLEKLIEVERALQHKNYVAARALVMQAEECVLKMDLDIIHAQSEKLRRAAYSRPQTASSLSKAQASLIAAVRTCTGNRRWRTIPKFFSRTLVTALRTSVQRLPYPI
jgi:hypothetical protein